MGRCSVLQRMYCTPVVMKTISCGLTQSMKGGEWSKDWIGGTV